MTYQETIDHLYAHLPMFSRVGAIAYKEDLHNTIALCKALGDPHKKFKSIHIAGTNGKGSTSHMLAAILQQAGYKTGLYTSPHLKDFRERIKMDGQMVKKDFVVDFVQRTRSLSDEIQPSFFELTVAKALLIKQYRHPLEETIIELPGGFVDNGEEPATAIGRELLEETGHEFSNIEYLGKVAGNPGVLTGYTHLYLARGGKEIAKLSLDANEEIEVLKLPLEKVRAMLNNNEIVQALHVSCLLYAFQKLDEAKR